MNNSNSKIGSVSLQLYICNKDTLFSLVFVLSLSHYDLIHYGLCLRLTSPSKYCRGLQRFWVAQFFLFGHLQLKKTNLSNQVIYISSDHFTILPVLFLSYSQWCKPFQACYPNTLFSFYSIEFIDVYPIILNKIFLKKRSTSHIVQNWNSNATRKNDFEMKLPQGKWTAFVNSFEIHRI